MKKRMKKLAQNLRNLLNKAQLSENELSRRTGIPQQMINRILSGINKNPKIATLFPLASYFMISLSQLIGDEPINKEIKLNIFHSGWNEIPLFEWNMLDQVLSQFTVPKSKKRILVDLDVSQHCFATTLKGNEMEPKFPDNTILVFDNKKEMVNGSFGLFYDYNENRIVFRQILIKKEQCYVKCLNPKSEYYKPKLTSNKSRFLSLLIQSKFNY